MVDFGQIGQNHTTKMGQNRPIFGQNRPQIRVFRVQNRSLTRTGGRFSTPKTAILDSKRPFWVITAVLARTAQTADSATLGGMVRLQYSLPIYPLGYPTGPTNSLF